VAPAGTSAYNLAFDVTPPGLVTAIVTETGVAQPVTAGNLRVLDREPSPTGFHAAVSMERWGT
jgi:methylthioribose-1-phosphate isomerase